LEPIEAMMPQAKRLQSLRWIVARTLLGAGVPLRLSSPDREVLEREILPYFASRDEFRRVLFVGCDWYTRRYERLFAGKEYITIEVDAARRPFGAKRHIVASLADLGEHVAAGGLDLVLCNGVFGWGLDAPDEASRAFAACAACLRPGGVLMLGWDDVAEHRPFDPLTLSALSALHGWQFPPFESSRRTVGTHVYDFFAKPHDALTGRSSQ
jgi:SAM-dependent methyltransferase